MGCGHLFARVGATGSCYTVHVSPFLFWNRYSALTCDVHSIHQPSSELFQQFDRMLLLQKGGKTVYFGDLGENATKVIRYFETNGGYPCPPDANPYVWTKRFYFTCSDIINSAEYMLDVIGAGATASTDINWSSVWRESPEAKEATQELENHIAQSRLRPPIVADHITEYAASWLYQVKVLYIREIQRHWRDPVLISSKLFLNVAGGLFVGLTFLRTKHNIIGTQNLLFVRSTPLQ
jgi:ATP-binding cassette, subfamily G (WHITE), member 2, PDR